MREELGDCSWHLRAVVVKAKCRRLKHCLERLRRRFGVRSYAQQGPGVGPLTTEAPVCCALSSWSPTECGCSAPRGSVPRGSAPRGSPAPAMSSLHRGRHARCPLRVAPPKAGATLTSVKH